MTPPLRRLLCIVVPVLFALHAGCSGSKSISAPVPAAQAVPVPPAASAAAKTPAPLPKGGVKGLYITGWVAGHPKLFPKALAMVERTELNALVIDVMDDGEISYDVDVPAARQAGANRRMIPDIGKVLAECDKRGIWTIARVTCFRDKVLPRKRPDLAVLAPDGRKVWVHGGKSWLNPFSKEAWEYPIAVARDAARRGFKEIQFDYIRFPSEGAVTQIVYPGRPDLNTPEGKRRYQIEQFVQYAAEQLRKEGVWVSADVFGEVSITHEDMGIGQTATNIARHVDYLCPMVYPDHYHPGTFGLPNPNANPYRTVLRSLQEHQKKFRADKVTGCKFRPWLQAFSISKPPPYSAPQLASQIKALKDLKIEEYLIWNARFDYARFEAALRTKKPAARVAGSSAGTSDPAVEP